MWQFLLVELVHPLRQLLHIKGAGDELARFIIKLVSTIGVMNGREDESSVFQDHAHNLRAVVGNQTEFFAEHSLESAVAVAGIVTLEIIPSHLVDNDTYNELRSLRLSLCDAAEAAEHEDEFKISLHVI